MESDYIEERDGTYWIRGERVSLDSIIYAFKEGLPAETIRDCFPVLTLEQVYGAITYYLAHRAEINEYLRKAEQEDETFADQMRARHPELHRKLDELFKTLPLRHR